MRLFIGCLFFSFNVLASNWSDLENRTDYKLLQNFQLPQLERSGSYLDFSKGDEVILNQITSLEMLQVHVLEFSYKKCPGPEMRTDMEIISVQATSPVVEVGAQFEDCILSIYVESKDLNTKSFIE